MLDFRRPLLSLLPHWNPQHFPLFRDFHPAKAVYRLYFCPEHESSDSCSRLQRGGRINHHRLHFHIGNKSAPYHSADTPFCLSFPLLPFLLPLFRLIPPLFLFSSRFPLSFLPFLFLFLPAQQSQQSFPGFPLCFP